MNKDDAVDLAVEVLLREGCSDITREELEISLISQFRDDFKKEVIAKLNRNSIHEMDFRSIQHILTPKNRYVFDYRKAAIITPSCAAKFLSIVFQYAHLVEKARVPIEKQVVFSYRFKPDSNGVFDRNVGYSQWREETKRRSLLPSVEYIVSCDIAGFYDRVNIHRIQSTLTSIGVAAPLVRQTDDLLLFWSKKDSYGIPVGNVASRILAEAALIDIDEYLISEKISFTRYVDDYRLFAPNLLIAQEWMNRLTTRLFRDGLMLNTGKTEIRRVIPEEVSKDKAEIEAHEESAETVLKVITKLVGGYNRIAKKFVMPAEDKHKRFMGIDLGSEIKIIQSQPIVEFDGVQKVVVAALVQKKFDSLIHVAKICGQYLYGMDYFIDMLLQNELFIPERERQEIADFYHELIDGGHLYAFEWHTASVAKLLSHPSYFRKEALLKIFKMPGKDVSTYASAIALEGLKGKINRTEFRTIREYFDRSDEWEKRRLLHLADALPDEERKAWVKAIKATVAGDFLATQLCQVLMK
ncbi:RNA-directed DNA polymerase [Roseateles chitinivorans]|uniref:RNA-directed DNA polymerase n=1 Tax=Roseateles chitinivorans TaxID=2917965 RepID=UPI003D66B761